MDTTAEELTIAGRRFKPVVNSTMRHDIYTMNEIRRAGLDRLNIREGETPGQFAVRGMESACSQGNVFELLGGLLMPAEVDPLDWTIALAKQTADFMASVHEADDKKKVERLIVSALTGFFVKGLSSSTLFPNSTNRSRESGEAQDGEIAASMTMATGT